MICTRCGDVGQAEICPMCGNRTIGTVSKPMSITEPVKEEVTHTAILKDGGLHTCCFCSLTNRDRYDPYEMEKKCCWCGVIRIFYEERNQVEGHGPFRRE